jgi:hypothetical protein
VPLILIRNCSPIPSRIASSRSAALAGEVDILLRDGASRLGRNSQKHLVLPQALQPPTRGQRPSEERARTTRSHRLRRQGGSHEVFAALSARLPAVSNTLGGFVGRPPGHCDPAATNKKSSECACSSAAARMGRDRP